MPTNRAGRKRGGHPLDLSQSSTLDLCRGSLMNLEDGSGRLTDTRNYRLSIISPGAIAILTSLMRRPDSVALVCRTITNLNQVVDCKEVSCGLFV
ncbi:MAG: hypothetical protein JWQ49_3753 [Edaphobacter sp.]|nr:hypothetical protein [Edaphobacter sp.]